MNKKHNIKLHFIYKLKKYSYPLDKLELFNYALKLKILFEKHLILNLQIIIIYFLNNINNNDIWPKKIK